MNEDYYLYIKRLFARWAPVYDLIDVFVSGVRDRVVELTNAKEGSKILDVGTGTGKQAFAFAKRGYNVVGIDLSEDMLNVANKKNKYGNVKFEVADATDIPFEDNCFDVSSVSFALHDMPLTIREKVLKEMVRVTKPRGIIVIVDYALPENKICRNLIYHLVRSYESRYYPGFIKSDLKALLRKMGVEIEKEVSIMFGSSRILRGSVK
jgi:demethylmenaquinone methyltransferase/2-methoxy-6-polyprenyl-1,4-benzoquinol methylase